MKKRSEKELDVENEKGLQYKSKSTVCPGKFRRLHNQTLNREWRQNECGKKETKEGE